MLMLLISGSVKSELSGQVVLGSLKEAVTEEAGCSQAFSKEQAGSRVSLLS